MALLQAPEEIRRALERCRRVAVLGAHPEGRRAAHYVPRYLAAHGYQVFPVNPRYAGQALFGRPVAASLADLIEPVELIDVFRRAEHLPTHLTEILALSPSPQVVWLQSGIRHDEVARALAAAGIDVVQERCMMIDHQRLL